MLFIREFDIPAINFSTVTTSQNTVVISLFAGLGVYMLIYFILLMIKVQHLMFLLASLLSILLSFLLGR